VKYVVADVNAASIAAAEAVSTLSEVLVERVEPCGLREHRAVNVLGGGAEPLAYGGTDDTAARSDGSLTGSAAYRSAQCIVSSIVRAMSNSKQHGGSTLDARSTCT